MSHTGPVVADLLRLVVSSATISGSIRRYMWILQGHEKIEVLTMLYSVCTRFSARHGKAWLAGCTPARDGASRSFAPCTAVVGLAAECRQSIGLALLAMWWLSDCTWALPRAIAETWQK